MEDTDKILDNIMEKEYSNIINPYRVKIDGKIRLEPSEIEILKNLKTELKSEYTRQSRREVLNLISYVLTIDDIRKGVDKENELEQEKHRLEEYRKTHPEDSRKALERIVEIDKMLYPYHGS